MLLVWRSYYGNDTVNKAGAVRTNSMVSRTLSAFVANAIIGLVILFLTNALLLGVEISLITVLICGILGVPGAILVILLALFDVAFTATVLPALAVAATGLAV